MGVLAESVRAAADRIARDPGAYQQAPGWRRCVAGYLFREATGRWGDDLTAMDSGEPEYRRLVEAVARSLGWEGDDAGTWAAPSWVSKAVFDSVDGYPGGEDAARVLYGVADALEVEEFEHWPTMERVAHNRIAERLRAIA